jgi:hypothetical protein
MLVKVANKDTALIKQSLRLPYRSLTWDRGKELADHQRLTLATEVKVYFCDPRSPWQRGSNENTNRLLRQYLPRGTDLSLHSQTKLSAIARQLNERPRKTLLYQTPAEKFAECVAATRRTSSHSIACTPPNCAAIYPLPPLPFSATKFGIAFRKAPHSDRATSGAGIQ